MSELALGAPSAQDSVAVLKALSVRKGADFPRAARLLQPYDFVRALKTRAQRGQFIWVYRRADIGSNPQSVRPRLGMMIGKKNARTSVLRNTVKRRIREQFRLRQTALPTSQYVVRLSSVITTKDVGAVIAEWTNALERDMAKLAATKTVSVANSKSGSGANLGAVA